MSGRWDGSLGGVQFRVLRDEDGASYRRSITRTGLQSQQLSDNAYQTRIDQPGFLQTGWSGGSAWWKPRLAGPNTNLFAASFGFDSWSQPGNLVPMNDAATVTTTASLGANALVAPHFGGIHALASTSTVNALYYDVKVWDPATNTWTTAAYTSGVPVTHQSRVVGHFELDDGTTARSWVFAVSATYPNGVISHYNSAGFTSAAFSPIGTRVGASFFPHAGNPWIYTGQLLRRLNDPYGTLVAENIQDDGHGYDFLDQMAQPANILFRRENINLAIPTTEGIYYVKNVRAAGAVTPFVYRVEVDANGAWTGIPVATLNPGSVCLGVAWHQGSLIMSVTDDVSAVLANDATKAPPKITLYHLTGGSIGVLGQPQGYTFWESLDPVWKFLGSDGSLLYIGGNQAVWAYDAVRGGIVRLNDHNLPDGTPSSMVRVLDSSGDSQLLFVRGDDWHTQTVGSVEDPTLVASFDTDLTTYMVESGVFDFGLPFEQKTISSVKVHTDPLTVSQQYTIQISADDSPYTPTWTTIAKHSNDTDGIAEYSFTPVTGHSFRYRIAYETKTAVNKAFKGIYFQATVGEQVRSWDMVLDMTEFRNVENEVVDPKVVVDLLEAAILANATITFVDGFESYDPSDQTSYTVKVQSYSNDKGNPNEGGVRLNLIEV